MRAFWARFVEITYSADATATFKVYTDLPGEVMAERRSATLAARTTREPVRVTLYGTTKGRLFQPVILPTGGFRLYRMRAYIKPLPGGDWTWVELPVVPTPEAWTVIRLPIPPTPDTWTEVRLPIPPTPDTWTAVPIPMRASQTVPDWVNIPTQGKLE